MHEQSHINTGKYDPYIAIKTLLKLKTFQGIKKKNITGYLQDIVQSSIRFVTVLLFVFLFGFMFFFNFSFFCFLWFFYFVLIFLKGWKYTYF